MRFGVSVADPESVIIEIHTAKDNEPDSLVVSLLPPTSISAGNVTFTPPVSSSVLLDANTSYFVVFDAPDQDQYSLSFTQSTSEDSDGLTGWTVGNKNLYRIDDGSYLSDTERIPMIALNGVEWVLPTVGFDNHQYNVLEPNIASHVTTFTVVAVVLDQAQNVEVTVDLAVGQRDPDVPALQGLDYDLTTPQTLTFSPGTTRVEVPIRIKGDDLIECSTEILNLVLSNPVNAQLGEADAGVHIEASDIGDVLVEIDAPVEGEPIKVRLSVEKMFGYDLLIEVEGKELSIPGVSADDGRDFVGTPVVAHFDPGELQALVEIPTYRNIYTETAAFQGLEVELTDVSSCIVSKIDYPNHFVWIADDDSMNEPGIFVRNDLWEPRTNLRKKVFYMDENNDERQAFEVFLATQPTSDVTVKAKPRNHCRSHEGQQLPTYLHARPLGRLVFSHIPSGG